MLGSYLGNTDTYEDLRIIKIRLVLYLCDTVFCGMGGIKVGHDDFSSRGQIQLESEYLHFLEQITVYFPLLPPASLSFLCYCI